MHPALDNTAFYYICQRHAWKLSADCGLMATKKLNKQQKAMCKWVWAPPSPTSYSYIISGFMPLTQTVHSSIRDPRAWRQLPGWQCYALRKSTTIAHWWAYAAHPQLCRFQLAETTIQTNKQIAGNVSVPYVLVAINPQHTWTLIHSVVTQ